jgi:hypothetical protein
VLVVTGIVVAGILVRAAHSARAALAFVGDHVDYVAWGRQAVAAGVRDLYRTPPKAPSRT